jgi:hypothetical protein
MLEYVIVNMMKLQVVHMNLVYFPIVIDVELNQLGVVRCKLYLGIILGIKQLGKIAK